MIARDSYRFILPLASAALLLTLGVVIWPLWVLRLLLWLDLAGLAFVIWFFRDPARRVPPGANLLVAPADGRVIAIRALRDPFVGAAQQISIFMNLFSVHVNRMVADGVVETIQHQPGRFLTAFQHNALTQNEQTRLELREGDRCFALIQIAGLIARRIVCSVQVGEHLARGQRFGLIRFGSRVEVIVPAAVSLRVKVGDRVRAGETIIGELR